jgi:hypothetical protein
MSFMFPVRFCHELFSTNYMTYKVSHIYYIKLFEWDEKTLCEKVFVSNLCAIGHPSSSIH